MIMPGFEEVPYLPNFERYVKYCRCVEWKDGYHCDGLHYERNWQSDIFWAREVDYILYGTQIGNGLKDNSPERVSDATIMISVNDGLVKSLKEVIRTQREHHLDIVKSNVSDYSADLRNAIEICQQAHDTMFVIECVQQLLRRYTKFEGHLNATRNVVTDEQDEEKFHEIYDGDEDIYEDDSYASAPYRFNNIILSHDEESHIREIMGVRSKQLHPDEDDASPVPEE